MAKARQTTSVKARIDAAVIHLLAEIGPAAVTVPRIAEQAGIAVGSIYRHYDSREVMIASVFAENYAAVAAELRQVIAPHVDAHDRIQAMVGFICRFFDERWDLARFLLLEQHSGLEQYDRGDSPIDVVSDVIVSGIADGELRPIDPHVIGALVVGPLVQAANFRLYGRLIHPLSTQVDALFAAIWRAIAPA